MAWMTDGAPSLRPHRVFAAYSSSTHSGLSSPEPIAAWNSVSLLMWVFHWLRSGRTLPRCLRVDRTMSSVISVCPSHQGMAFSFSTAAFGSVWSAQPVREYLVGVGTQAGRRSDPWLVVAHVPVGRGVVEGRAHRGVVDGDEIAVVVQDPEVGMVDHVAGG